MFYLVLIICINVFCLSLYLLFSIYSEEHVYVVKAKEGTNVVIDDNLRLENKYLYLKKEYNNEDIIGSIFIPSLSLNSLFVKTNNNTYYLNHSITKEYSKLGALYIDYRTGFDDKQVNIYGHSSKNYNIPFNSLISYLDKEFVKNNLSIYIEMKEGVLKYRIYSVKVTKSNEHMNIIYNDLDTWNSHLSIMREDLIYDSKEEVLASDQILVLQTCILDNSNNYLIITAKRI